MFRLTSSPSVSNDSDSDDEMPELEGQEGANPAGMSEEQLSKAKQSRLVTYGENLCFIICFTFNLPLPGFSPSFLIKDLTWFKAFSNTILQVREESKESHLQAWTQARARSRPCHHQEVKEHLVRHPEARCIQKSGS